MSLMCTVMVMVRANFTDLAASEVLPGLREHPMAGVEMTRITVRSIPHLLSLLLLPQVMSALLHTNRSCIFI